MHGVRRTRHRYGAQRGQVGDLWLPERTGGHRLPVVVLIHGGYWRSPYTKALMNDLARAVATRGWAAWNVEYRRVGPFGGGGGWPVTLADVEAAVDHVTSLPSVDPERAVTCGHSAGGCLALWVANRHRTPDSSSGATRRVQPRGAVSLAGVVDLRRGAELGLGRGAVAQFLGGSFEQYPTATGRARPRHCRPGDPPAARARTGRRRGATRR